MKSRVLVADSQQALQTVQKIIGELVEVVPAETMLEAEQALQSPLAMVICGIHFDGSNMFQLLGLVRGRFSHIPFIVFRDLPSALDPTFAQSVQISAKLMGALGLIDLYSFRQQYGIEEADRRFRHMVMHALDVGSLQ